jgi:MoaA/NifB/PqqE/SkfB family radical SAM enzyme
MDVAFLLPRVTLPKDLFSRFYRLKNGETTAIVYRTLNQAVATLDADSAEVWRRLFDADGDTAPALDYITQSGCFDGDPLSAARKVLADFLRDLEQTHLLGDQRRKHEIEQVNSLHCTVSVAENLENVFAQKMADEHLLYSLVVELTYGCNEHCVHCYLPENRKIANLTLPQLDALLAEFHELGGFSLLLTGGELLTRPDIAEIFALAKNHGFITSLVSNLTLLDDSTLQAIVDLCPRSVGCSIYSARPELHDAITALPGSFEKSLRSIRRLREAGVPVLFKTPLLQSTAPHWREVETLGHELGCGNQFDLSITAKNDGKLSPLAQRVTDSGLLNEIFSSQFYNLNYSGEQITLMNGPDEDAGLCGAGASSLTVGPDGEIRPCVGLNLAIGHYPEDTLTDVWRGSPFFKTFGTIRAKDVKECAECCDFAFCSRCPGAWHAEHGSYMHPTEYTCFLGHALGKAQRNVAAKNSQRGGGEN